MRFWNSQASLPKGPLLFAWPCSYAIQPSRARGLAVMILVSPTQLMLTLCIPSISQALTSYSLVLPIVDHSVVSQLRPSASHSSISNGFSGGSPMSRRRSCCLCTARPPSCGFLPLQLGVHGPQHMLGRCVAFSAAFVIARYAKSVCLAMHHHISTSLSKCVQLLTPCGIVPLCCLPQAPVFCS